MSKFFSLPALLGRRRTKDPASPKKPEPQAGAATSTGSSQTGDPPASGTGKKAKKPPKPRDLRPWAERHLGLVRAMAAFGGFAYWMFCAWWVWPLENTFGPLVEWVNSRPRIGFVAALMVGLAVIATTFTGAIIAGQSNSLLPLFGSVAAVMALFVALRLALNVPMWRTRGDPPPSPAESAPVGDATPATAEILDPSPPA